MSPPRPPRSPEVLHLFGTLTRRPTSVPESGLVMLHHDQQPPAPMQQDTQVPPCSKPRAPLCGTRAPSRAASNQPFGLAPTRCARALAPPVAPFVDDVNGPPGAVAGLTVWRNLRVTPLDASHVGAALAATFTAQPQVSSVFRPPYAIPVARAPLRRTGRGG